MSATRPERLLGMVAVLLLAGALVVFIALSAVPAATPSGETEDVDRGPGGPTERAQVLRVVDGDTIVVRVGGREERVRYVGLDAPEIANAGAGAGADCGGDEARAANDRLVAGEELVLERDVSDRDRFGRLLRHAWLASGAWRLVGLELVEAGAVEARSYPPDTARDSQLDAAQRRARDQGAGIWGACR